DFGIARQAYDLPDERLAGMILRVRFAGNDDLYRHAGIVDNLLQAINIAKQQSGALVGSKAARETDSEDVGIEDFRKTPHLGRGRFPPHGRLIGTLANKGDHAPLALAVHLPQFLGWNLVNELPHFSVFETLA